jgi:hypothetical protein
MLETTRASVLSIAMKWDANGSLDAAKPMRQFLSRQITSTSNTAIKSE